MGFSVSVTYLLLFVGLLFAMGMLHATVSNSIEEVREAQQFQNDHIAAIQSAKVTISSVTLVDAAACDLNVTATNTGETLLERGRTDVLADGSYEENLTDRSEVDGADSDLWRPGQDLEIDLGAFAAAPDRIKLIAGPGVADATEVSGITC